MRGSDRAPAPADAPAGTAPPPVRRLVFALLALALLCALCAPFFADMADRNAPSARGGVVDYSHYGPLAAPAPLAGEWRLTWRGGQPGAPAAGAQGMATVPGAWTGARVAGGALPARGVATYSLTVRGLAPGRYILHVPTLFESSEVRVDGQRVSGRGVVGLTSETTRDEVRSQDIILDADGRDIRLEITLASFHHRDNGFETAPVLGLAEPMSRWTTLGWLRGFMFVTATLLLACYGLVVFLFRPRDRASLYIAISALFLLPIAAIFSHDNLILIAFPGLSLRGMLTLQYISGLAAVGFFLAYAHHLFPNESRRSVFWTLEGLFAFAIAAHAVALALGDTLLASQMSFWALPLRATTFLYMVGVVLTAAWRKRDGALIFLLGLSVFAASLITYDLLTNGLIRHDKAGLDLPALGILVLVFSHIVILAERWTLSIDAAEQTAGDLRRLLDVNAAITSEMELEALLTKIVQVTSRIIHADRSSLFLYDARTDELWSLVAEGLETRVLRFPAHLGLAGACFASGQPINITDAYADPRFHRDVDALTGYRTSSVLTIPVTARDGRRLGVMQALNRQDRPHFSDGDMERMAAFAAQAAIAIDNATLFSEVATERNYNESILRSMSSGVLTLDTDARIAKLNDAACRILAVPADRMAGADARVLLAANPGLLDEFAAVSRSGQPKTLVDADLVTGRGDTISANLSIVPLVSEGEAVGLLVLLEDITEGKRLQGAMRRFMSQEVVDQVLSHDDLLFGDACRASVLFADIRNFTTLAETLSPRATVEVLNEIYTELFEAVSACHGVLDKFLGDAIMAHWGAPIPGDRDPVNAVEAAVQMLKLAEALNRRRQGQGLPELRLGMGIATGEVIAGAIGSPKRMDYTVIGDSVNLAARLEALTKVYGVGLIVCEATAAAVADQGYVLRELDVVRVRGRRQPSRIFQVLTGEAPAAEAYDEGRRHLAAGDWAAATEAFKAARAADPADGPSALMLTRARALEIAPPPEGWDGVWGEG
ncbi:adenylate/guanylate cyclase domain-containing protein [Phenylobacterium sp.]|uniref:GAF domain-containing protein n=1 Tax=Phenylobacterium sp. TaxID=1871053 RepID=UPI0025F543A4|nr:adenylate/guanylate cyclase domain-containing protein [Phenylobacterium sp.]